MRRKRLKQNTHLQVKVKYAATYDSERRLAHAIGILLSLAQKQEALPKYSINDKKKEPPIKNPSGDELTHAQEGDSHEPG